MRHLVAVAGSAICLATNSQSFTNWQASIYFVVVLMVMELSIHIVMTARHDIQEAERRRRKFERRNKRINFELKPKDVEYYVEYREYTK